jgi:hypothetical protein
MLSKAMEIAVASAGPIQSGKYRLFGVSCKINTGWLLGISSRMPAT